MPYTPTTWVNDQAPPLSAANLNKLANELKSAAAASGVAQAIQTWLDGAAPALTDPINLNEMERVTAAVASSLGLSYTPTTWKQGWTPARNAANFNKLEAQAQANRAAIEALPSPTPIPPYPANVRPGYGLDTGNFGVVPVNVRPWFVNIAAVLGSDYAALSNQQAVAGGANVHAVAYKNLTVTNSVAPNTGATFAQAQAWDSTSPGYAGKGAFLYDSNNAIITTSDPVNPGNRPLNLQVLINHLAEIIDNVMNNPTTGLNQFTHINAIWLDQIASDVRTVCYPGSQLTWNSNNANTPPEARYLDYVGVGHTGGIWGTQLLQYYRLACSWLQQILRPDGGIGYYLIANASAFNNGSANTSNQQDTVYFWDTFLRYPTVAEGNTLGRNSDGTPNGQPFRPGQPIFDGYNAEGWQVTISGVPRNNSHVTFRDYWDERQMIMRTAQGLQTAGAPTPRAFYGMVEALSPSAPSAADYQNARYTRGSHYLEWDGGYGVPYIRSYDNSAVWNTTNDLAGYVNHQLGFPTGPKVQIASGVWRRDGASGGVAVNSNGSAVTLTINGVSRTIPAADVVFI